MAQCQAKKTGKQGGKVAKMQPSTREGHKRNSADLHIHGRLKTMVPRKIGEQYSIVRLLKRREGLAGQSLVNNPRSAAFCFLGPSCLTDASAFRIVHPLKVVPC